MNKPFTFVNPPSVISAASVVGSTEYAGPLGARFDLHSDDDRFGMQTWEKSEAESQRLALNLALSKRKLSPDTLGAVLAGDLINQCTSSAFGLVTFGAPFLGLYGACSTMAEGLMLASVLYSAGHVKSAAAVTSSHFCSAERQFRTPLEYGSQKTPTAQRTVTGSAAFILGEGGDIVITKAMAGILTDGGITDQANMGAAMAPAAAGTLLRFFKATKTAPSDYSLIATGDLGAEGHDILLELLDAQGVKMPNCTDCGLLVYDRSKQDVHAGGSGCGCSAVVLASYLLDELRNGGGKMLFVGTGALMSPLTVMQGENIPGIAHLVQLERKET